MNPADKEAARLVVNELVKFERHTTALTTLYFLFNEVSTGEESTTYAEMLACTTSDPLDRHWDIGSFASQEIDEETQAKADANFRGVAAGTIFIVAGSAMQAVGRRLRLAQPRWLDTGAEVYGVRLGKLVWAAADNWRHYDEWSRVSPKNLPSIEVLQQLGLNAPWNENKCAEVLTLIVEALNLSSYEDFAHHIRCLLREQFWVAFPDSEVLGRRR